jgi:CHRD domain
MRLMSYSTFSALAVVALLASPARADTVTLKASMNAASEVPPNDSKATGTLTATYDTGSKLLSWKGSYSGLSGAATAAHFHGPAEPGKNAPVAVPIQNPIASFEGSAPLTDVQAADLLAGRYYVNVHTEANKGGEIRGQVTK